MYFFIGHKERKKISVIGAIYQFVEVDQVDIDAAGVTDREMEGRTEKGSCCCGRICGVREEVN